MNDVGTMLSLNDFSNIKLNLDNLELAEKIYSLAKKNEFSRADFIKMIDLGNYNKYVSKLTYFANGKGVMTFRPNTFVVRFGLKGFKSKISIFKDAFNDSIHENFADFYSTLIFHEGFHAKDIYENGLIRPSKRDLFATELFDYDLELRAYINQRNNLHPKNSSKYISIVKNRADPMLLSDSVLNLEKLV